MRLLPLIALPLLAGCGLDVDTGADTARALAAGVEVAAANGKASIAVGGESGFKIDTDSFKAALDIPGMSMGGKDFDIDGMKLYPGLIVRGMSINARDAGSDKHGTVKVTFTSPAAPYTVLAHAAKEAAREGFAMGRTGLGLTGSNGKDKSVAYLVAAEGTGTRGTLTLTGKHSESWRALRDSNPRPTD